MTEVEAPAPTKRRRITPQLPLSLTKASKTVGVSMGTLRRAIDDGKLKAEKTPEGHYRIPVDHLMQYQINELGTHSVMGDATPAAPVPSPSTERGDARRSVEGSVTRSVGGDDRVMFERLHEAEKDALRVEVKHQKDAITRLERDVETWQGQADKWQAQTENYKFLLTDERDAAERLKSELAEEQAQTPRPRGPIAVAAVLILAVGACALYLYPDTVRDLLRGQGVPVVDAAALEVVPDLESVATDDLKAAQDTNPPR